MRKPQEEEEEKKKKKTKERAAGSQEEGESGNSCGHPINFKLTEPFPRLPAGLRRRLLFMEIKANLIYLSDVIVIVIVRLRA